MNRRRHIQDMAVAGLLFGAGIAIGSILAIGLINNEAIGSLTEIVGRLQLFLRLLFAIFLLFVFTGLSGGVGGAIGGWGLARVSPLEDKRHVIWRTALAFFITHALLIIPLILASMVIGFLNQNLDARFGRLPTLFFVYGLIYGALAGLMLGWLLVGLRNSLSILLASAAGFAIGGWLAGAALYFFAQDPPANRWLILLAVTFVLFLFGGAGGAALGLVMPYAHEGRAIIPQTQTWRIMRTAVLIIIALSLLSALAKLIDTLTIKPGRLAETLPLTTVGTHWQAVDDESAALNPGVLPPLEMESRFEQIELFCANGQLQLAIAGIAQELPETLFCSGDPLAAVDSDGRLHLLWTSDRVLKPTGELSGGHFIMEVIEQDQGWSTPAIIARPAQAVQPRLSVLADGRLLLEWSEGDQQRQLTYAVYRCEDVPLSRLSQIVFDVARQEKYRPVDDPIPYCKNRYEQLMVTPNPTNPASDVPKSSHGAFDRVAELVREADYEVLFTTMQWDAPSDTVSPGDTLAGAVFDLYEKVRANPENYPRGMTVRIMLGNLPELAVFEPTNQVTHLMQDLHDAGLREMVNEEIGWRLELANYAGAWPHAHSKFLVVDGKSAVAAGFNYSYLHLDKEDPSGLGLSMNDLGIQISGPVAQSVMAAYDDLWSGSTQYHCSRFPPLILMFWFLWCDEVEAVAEHVPEVQRFYVTEGETTAFSLHHTMRYLESDEAILGVLDAAENSIDVYHVNFSLNTVCVVITLLTGSCPFGDLAPPYMQALARAAIERDVHIRALMETTAMNGLENRMAIRWLQNELAKNGKSDNVQFKFYNGKMHDKSALIDDQFLIVGSQNFHWSAWDTPSLTEYNMATDDPLAISDFKGEFEHQWGLGIPVEEQMQVLEK